jgi:kumamolisin
MRQVSISLGLGETFMGGPDGEVAIEHQKFGRLALAGVNVFVSTGDAGSVPDQSGHGRGEVKQAEYESSDSNVVAVGGTSLKLNTATGSVQDESGWTDGGGGESIFFDRPAWQKGLGINSGTRRLVPDVSAAADPNTGALIILQGSQLQYGGTSWSAPMWAGFCALMNADRAEHQKPMLPFLCPLIYPLSGTGAFRDVTAGSNGDYTATAGHDMVTGLGVPNVGALSARLESAVPVPNSH